MTARRLDTALEDKSPAPDNRSREPSVFRKTSRIFNFEQSELTSPSLRKQKHSLLKSEK